MQYMGPAAASKVDRDAVTMAPPASGLVGLSPSAGEPSSIDRRAMTEAPPECGSARPTSVPDCDDGGHRVLADLTIPVRKGPAPREMELRTAFLFLHIDDVSTIAEIAVAARLPLPEVAQCFLHLVELGAVELGDAEPRGAPAESGVFPRFGEKGLAASNRKTG